MPAPRFTAPERLALILLLLVVAAAAGWRWWRLERAGEQSRRALPESPRFDPTAGHAGSGKK